MHARFSLPGRSAAEIGVLSVAALPFLGLFFWSARLGPAGLGWYTAAVLAYYVTFITIIVLRFEQPTGTNQRLTELILLLLVACHTILLIACFGLGWAAFGQYGSASGPCDGSGTGITPFYFSTILFTSVGFGDFVPCSDGARLFAMEEAVVGHFHTVVFFSMLLGRWVRSRRLCPPGGGH
ncbi:two pore domain potassium channel family protein [Oxalobacteraceae bacterium OM1]|nr:two pore domain potassium channel family protein [Oxalobacteraceae bacterium OM1]